MKKITKRLKDLYSRVNREIVYNVENAVMSIKSLASAKFDETVEIAIRLGVDPRHADQMIRGSVVLPHGTGKKVKVAVFAKGIKADEAKSAGADIIGDEDLVQLIKNGEINFDMVIATPDMMATVGKIGKILGPKGLMPNPKTGTVTNNVADAVKNAKSGQVNFRVDKKGNIHAPLGKASFDTNKIIDNLLELVKAVNRLKPASAKGKYIKKVSIALTMSPSLEIDTQELVDIK